MPLLKKALSGIMNMTPEEVTREGSPAAGMIGFSGINSLFGHFSSDAYASAYPSIRAITNEYMAVMPYAIDANGKKVEQAPAVNAMYHPNKLDSSVAFFEKIAVSTLVLPKTYILVWHREGKAAVPGGDFKNRSTIIAGYTFLEYPAVSRRDGKTYYKIGAQEFNEDEVIVLPGGTDPRHLYEGYSPSESARRWAKLDDYIADYQSGFFENGAVPAGQFLITAATVQDYNDTVDMLQRRHRGAGKNGNVTYSHRPIDPNSGKPAQAQIEWVPFSQANKDIDFKNLFEQVNNRIDVAFGVPAIVKGIDDAATYANAQVAEKTFAKRAVKPLLLRNYTQFTHELNRITNGLGYAITFEYEIPTVSDEEKVDAETKQIEGTIIRDMVGAGYTLDSVIDAFKFSNSYKNLRSGKDSTTTIKNDKPDVDEGNEVEESPDPAKIDGVTPVNNGEANRTNPKAELSDTDVEAYEVQLSGVIRDHMSKQIEDAISGLDNENAVTQEAQQLADDMMVIITAVLTANGFLQYSEGITLLIALGYNVDNTTSFVLSEEQIKNYTDYLKNVGQSYMDDTAVSIRNVLERGNIEGWTRNELEAELRNIMNTDEWRVGRLARSEVNRSQQMGSIYSMQQIEGETDVTFQKKWMTTGSNPCPTCSALDGSTEKLDVPFMKVGDAIETADGGMYVNEFVDMQTAQAHPNDHCVIVYEVVK